VDFGGGFFFFEDGIVGVLGGEDLGCKLIDVFFVELLFLEEFVVKVLELFVVNGF
jgi:hypothetical protein